MHLALKHFLGSIGETVCVRGGKTAEGYVSKLDMELIAAGEPGELKGTELLGVQVVAAVVLPVFWGAVFSQIGFLSFLFAGPKQILVYLGLFLLGFLFPAMNVRERAAKRKHIIALQLPETLDLLTISVEAGMDFMSALRRVVEKHRPGPLKDELERLFKRTELGIPRRDALREMANRVQLQDLGAVVSALIQADRLGVSIGPILATQSDMMRIRRGQRCEKAAQQAPVKMLAPLMTCIMPAVFIMILAPVFIQMIMDFTE